MSAPEWSRLTAKRLAGRITDTRVSSARGAAPMGHWSAVGRRGERRNDGVILSPRCRVLAARKGYANPQTRKPDSGRSCARRLLVNLSVG